MFASLKQLFVAHTCSGKLELTCSCTTHPSETAGEFLPDNLLSVSWTSWSQYFLKLAETHGWDHNLMGWFSPTWFYPFSCCHLFLMNSVGALSVSAASPLPVIFPCSCVHSAWFLPDVSRFISVPGTWEKVALQSCVRAKPQLTGTFAPGRSFAIDWSELLCLFSNR